MVQPILQYTLNNRDLLPVGYTPIAYLLSDGNLWINTGVTISGNVYAQGKVVTTDTSGERDWIGNYNNSTSGGFVVGQYNSKHYVYSSNGGSTNNGTIEANVIYEHYASLTSSKGEILANGISYTGSARNVTVTNTVTLFRRGDSNCYWKGKVYFARLWQDNTLKGDWRPCIQDSNGVIGMYDLVSRTFKTNAGSGSFIAGPELAVGKGGGKSLPEEYLLVEYLEALSYNLYLDLNTPLKGDETTTIIAMPISYQNDSSVLVGPSNGAYLIAKNRFVYHNSSGTRVDISTSAIVINTINTLIINNSSNQVTCNGTVITTLLNGLLSSDGSLHIFKPNGYSNGEYNTIGKIYKVHTKVKSTGVCTHNFIPCYRKSDMKPGMYDVVNGVFYTNAGSGEFILGPTITNYYTWEPNAGSGTLQGLYTNVSGIYDSSKGWVADFSTSSVEMPGLLTLLGSSTNFSFAIWFKRSSGGGWNTIWGCSGFELDGSRNGGATNLVIAYTWGQSSGGIEYTLNEWHHLVMTRNASESKFYLDGELKYTGSAASIPNTALFLGAWKQHGSQSYLGQMTNMMLFDTVLTAAQVKELYGK